MARPNDPNNRYEQKKAEPVQDQAQEQEEEVQKDANESEHKQNHQQNTLGNQAIQNQMITAGTPGGQGDGGGGGGLAMRKAGQDAGREFGGDDDDVDDLPLTLEDLVRSWNPGTPKSKDRPSWLEPMPSDELPPEDEAYLDAVRGVGVQRVPRSHTLDSQLQPSRSVVAASLLDWGRAVHAWCSTDLVDRTLARSFVPGASHLHDPDGRVLLARVRTGAIGSLLIQRSPALRDGPSGGTLGFVQFCLELQGHRRHAEMVRIDPGVEGKQMPKTGAVLARSFSGTSGRVEPRALPEQAQARLSPVLDLLLDLEDPEVYLPSLTAAPAVDIDDDPLGLDAILAQFTGGAPEPDEPLYYSAMQSAERLAAATARTRVHVAACSTSIAQVARLWSAGPPLEHLQQVAQTIDQETDRNLRLLVEIARAAKRKSVPPKGLKAGLTRAVRALRNAHRTARDLLSEIVGGLLPGLPSVPAPEEAVRTPLDEAWADGVPGHALPWLRSLPPGPLQRALVLLVELEAGRAPGEVGPELLAAASDLDDPLLQEILRVHAGPCLLLGAQLEAAVELSRRQLEIGVSRRNGMLLANATLLGMEAHRLAGDDDALSELWTEGGQRAWGIGAPGALTVLARYSLPAD